MLLNFSKIIDEDLGVTDVMSMFLLKIFDEDEDKEEGAVNNVDCEVCEEDKYPEEYYVGVWKGECEHMILVQRPNQQSQKV